jgi:hypothetical protein
MPVIAPGLSVPSGAPVAPNSRCPGSAQAGGSFFESGAAFLPESFSRKIRPLTGNGSTGRVALKNTIAFAFVDSGLLIDGTVRQVPKGM